MVEDAGIVAAPLKYLLITPLIYFFIFFVCVAILILSKGLERVSRIKYYWPFALGGVAWSIVNVWLLYTTAKSFNATIFVLILSVGAALSFLVFVVARLLNFTLLKDRVNAFVLDGQLLDATATSFGLTFLPYAEKHVLPNFLIEATGTAFVMYPLKLIVTIPVLFIVDEYFKGRIKKSDWSGEACYSHGWPSACNQGHVTDDPRHMTPFVTRAYSDSRNCIGVVE